MTDSFEKSKLSSAFYFGGADDNFHLKTETDIQTQTEVLHNICSNGSSRKLFRHHTGVQFLHFDW